MILNFKNLKLMHKNTSELKKIIRNIAISKTCKLHFIVVWNNNRRSHQNKFTPKK